MNELNPYQALQQQDLFVDFEKQLRKDFEGAGQAIAEDAMIPRLLPDLQLFLTQKVKEISRHGSLQGLLYRIDISEHHISMMGQKQPDLLFEELLSDLIIRRILQKIILRKKFTS